MDRDPRRWGKGDNTLHCHHQNDSCIKMDSGESHFNVSLIVRDSHKTEFPDHKFQRVRRAEAESNRGPSAYQPNILPLGQAGAHKDAHMSSKATKGPAPQKTNNFTRTSEHSGVE